MKPFPLEKLQAHDIGFSNPSEHDNEDKTAHDYCKERCVLIYNVAQNQLLKSQSVE